MCEKEKFYTDIKHRESFIKNHNSKYSPEDWYIYYRDSLKIFLKDYYNIEDLFFNVIVSDLIPKDTFTYMFWIEESKWIIYLYIDWKKINVSDYVENYIKKYKL